MASLAWSHDEQVGAHVFDAFGDACFGSISNADHRDDGRDTNDDTEHGQQRTKGIGAQAMKRDSK
jgi:hypothetical protein